jgi:uncharacterized membrane protein
VPSLIVAGSIVLAVALIGVDFTESEQWLARWPRLFGVGADGARGMLSTIAGSMMTVVGVTFSMVLMTLALASNQYTSRILRNFMSDRVMQVVLGVFAGIFTYCLIVLRTIRSGEDGAFVPSLAVSFSVVLAMGGIGILIFFIHHIAALQAAYTIDRHRTVEQDSAFGIRQIVDMALKALSPGINDTTTAVMCVDYLSAILARLASRPIPSSHRYEGENCA